MGNMTWEERETKQLHGATHKEKWQVCMKLTINLYFYLLMDKKDNFGDWIHCWWAHNASADNLGQENRNQPPFTNGFALGRS